MVAATVTVRRLVYHPDAKGGRRSVAFHGTVATGFLAVGVAVWVLPASITGASTGAQVGISVLALAGALIFGWVAVSFLQRLRSDSPLVVLEPDGLFDNGSAMFSGVGWIPWSDVEEIRLGSYQGLPCVEVVLHDRNSFLRRLSWLERPGRSARLGYPAVAFRGPLLPEEPERMVEEMRAYLSSVLEARERGPADGVDSAGRE